MTSQETRDYKDLTAPEARTAYFASLFARQIVKTDNEALDDLKGYIGFLADGLEGIGLEEAEATRTAADTVFGGLAGYMKEYGKPSDTMRLDHMDKLLRREHDIDERLFPINHEDPIVASYYTSLGGHLLVRMPGDRVDSFGGYYQE